MITIKELSFSYDKKSPVIRQLNLEIRENGIHGIVGLNGAGKTTLLNLVYGLMKPDSGSVNLNDQRLSRREVGYLETENFFYSNITGQEHLNIFKAGTAGFDVNRWNELFKLPLKELVESYSTGMKKKLAIMAVIKQDKPIMILDEPFNGLDLETVKVFESILSNLKAKKTIIITSHIIETLTSICDEISYLEEGEILFTRGEEHFTEFRNDIFQRIESRNAELVKTLTTNSPNPL